MPLPTLQVTSQITESFGAPIKQYAGQSQVNKGVRVKVPGKHFTGLLAAEQKLDYWVSPPTLPPPLRRLKSKPALILPFAYGHVVWLKKCISP